MHMVQSSIGGRHRGRIRGHSSYGTAFRGHFPHFTPINHFPFLRPSMIILKMAVEILLPELPKITTHTSVWSRPQLRLVEAALALAHSSIAAAVQLVCAALRA